MDLPLCSPLTIRGGEAPVKKRKKKKNPKLKRNIRFDDELMDLFMDYCLDTEATHPVWKKLNPDNAKAARRNLPADQQGETTEEELDAMLTGTNSQ